MFRVSERELYSQAEDKRTSRIMVDKPFIEARLQSATA